jgi:eukaryotic-like serine/threonine-protein kinase
MHLQRLGPFRLERLLGRGGMGAVYVGQNDETGQRAAIKLLSGHLADDETFRERFKQEIETLKRLLHPNIVQLFGYGEEDGHLYYVMELVEGRSLQDELSVGRRFNWREVARIGIAIALSLKHAHDRGIIHRDLKPANLLIDAQDHIKLTDFGIAKLYGGANVTVEGGVLGTADYMSPEQSHGQQVTVRCDLYALGSVLYALLTGKPPFSGKTLAEVVTALQKDRPIAVRRLAPDTPEEFERIVLQLLEKEPQQRIPTAIAVANRLKAMERALSLETRVGDEQDEDELPPKPISQPHSAITQAADVSGQPTTAQNKEDDDEYRLASDAPTKITEAGGSSAPSDRTALATQAGKKTGAGSAGGTHSERSQGTPASEPAAKQSRFVTVSEDELRGGREVEDSPLKQWGIAAVLAAIGIAVIGGAVFMAMQRPSADRLYKAINTIAARESPGELASVESEIGSFLESYPDDPRRPEVAALKDKLAAYRLERKSAVRGLRTTVNSDATPLELAYHEAASLASTDPETGLAHYEAIVAVFGDGNRDDMPPTAATDKQWLELARQQAIKLGPEVRQLKAERQNAIERQLARARLEANDDRAAAEAIWRGLITLYRDKAWAAEFIAEAEAGLRNSKANSAGH